VARCRLWLQENDAEHFARLYPAEADALAAALAASLTLAEPSGPKVICDEDAATAESVTAGEEKGGQHQSRGGKALLRDDEKKRLREEERRRKARVTVTLVDRNKRKSVTHVGGLDIFGLDLKRVAKRLAGKYACGCSVVSSPAGLDEIVIQGDIAYDLVDFLPAEFPEVPAAQVDLVDKSKK
jgi:density-regulated protein DRP1